MKGIYGTLADGGDFVLDEQMTKPSFDEQSVLIRIKGCNISSSCDSAIKPLLDLLKRKGVSRLPIGVSVTGQVEQVGHAVSTLKEGDTVAGLLSWDLEQTGCTEYCVLREFDIVKIPDNLDALDVAGGLIQSVKAFSALHYQARLCSGDTVLIMDGAMQYGVVMVQLALHWGAKVLTTVKNEDEKAFLEKNHPSIAQIILLEGNSSLLVSSVVEETGGLGVDCIVDFGVKQFPNERHDDEKKNYLPLKHDIITCLAVGGRWVTSQSDLQLDPPNSQILFMKGASVSFLFEHCWALSSSQQGRYQHILREVVEKFGKKIIRPNVKVVTFDKVLAELKTCHSHDQYSVVVRMLDSYS